MSDVYDRRSDPQFFRDTVRLFRAARAVVAALHGMTERQRHAVMNARELGPALRALQAAVAMLDSYRRRPRQGE